MARKTKLNMDDFAEFFWDYRSQPPLAAIVKFSRLAPHLKCYDIDNGTDTHHIVFAPSARLAERWLRETDSFVGKAIPIKKSSNFQG
jgi:hypothetical protein